MNFMEIIERRVIEPMGYVGALYDVCRECVIQQLTVNTKETQSPSAVNCELIRGNENILQMIGIEQDSTQVATLLNSSLKTGINALLDRPDSTNEYTRFLHGKYIHRFEELDTSKELPDLSEFPNTDDNQTHMITGIDWGIEVVVVLQLPSNIEMVNTIDEILRKIQIFLQEDAADVKFTLQDELIFEKNVRTTIYSNIPTLTSITSLFALCQYIHGRNDRLNLYRPVKYRLEPIKKLYPTDETNVCTSHSSLVDKLEQNLIQIVIQMRRFKCSSNSPSSDTIHTQLQRLHRMAQTWIELNKAHEENMERLHSLLTGIYQKVKDNDQILPESTPLVSHEDVLQISPKEKFIDTLEGQNFECYDAMKLDVREDNYVQILSKKLMSNPESDRILCSSDGIKEKNPVKWEILFNQLIEERKQNPSLNLIYVDFTSCSFEPSSIILLPTSAQNEMINILLLGESGVGKSTFINAFVNYLTFETLAKAESKEPVTLIPIFFLLSVGDNFEQRRVYFGPPDNFNNEDFDHPGQSVTQQCRSYVFTLPHLLGMKLRLIDTPGFGDTRGVEQDEMNMQHIFKYLTNFTHINSVCFLLKSDQTQLNKYFSICLTQLFDFLGPDASKNIIFCFTNTRSTFYAPGNITPVLKSTLQSFPIKDIPFRKGNTFCFDNESFRYLVALRNGLNLFDGEHKEDYEISWRISLKESYRLVNCVITKLKSYVFDNTRESVSSAQMEINKMVRPILETMKNNLRHIILQNMKISNRSIQLTATAIERRIGRCFLCPKTEKVISRFCGFAIARNDAHEISKDCHQCNHKPSEHYFIDYVLNYEQLDTPLNLNEQEMEDKNAEFLQISVDFAYFLKHVARVMKEDFFLAGITSMEIEESELCRIEKSNTFNSKLRERLGQLCLRYENKMNEMARNSSQISLQDIYRHMQKIRTFPEISQQLDAAEESQRILTKEYEHIVRETPIE